MDSFAKCKGAKTASDLIVRLAGTQKPVLRKEGAPVTFEKMQDIEKFLK